MAPKKDAKKAAGGRGRGNSTSAPKGRGKSRGRGKEPVDDDPAYKPKKTAPKKPTQPKVEKGKEGQAAAVKTQKAGGAPATNLKKPNK